MRKLIFVFKHLRHVAEPPVLKIIYQTLCQSLIIYCITSWGGAPKTALIIIERAQRALLKVATFKPFLFPTHTLYDYCEVLSVRKLFVLYSVLMQHSLTPIDAEPNNNKRNHLVAKSYYPKTSFSQRFFCFLGPFLYNNLNGILHIHSLPKLKLKKIISEWLHGLTYDSTENLLHPMI